MFWSYTLQFKLFARKYSYPSSCSSDVPPDPLFPIFCFAYCYLRLLTHDIRCLTAARRFMHWCWRSCVFCTGIFYSSFEGFSLIIHGVYKPASMSVQYLCFHLLPLSMFQTSLLADTQKYAVTCFNSSAGLYKMERLLQCYSVVGQSVPSTLLDCFLLVFKSSQKQLKWSMAAKKWDHFNQARWRRLCRCPNCTTNNIAFLSISSVLL